MAELLQRPPTFLPVVNGRYLYLIMCLICRFIVTKKRIIQYISRMGQNTGTSKTLKKVIRKPITKDFMDAYLQVEGRGGRGSHNLLLTPSRLMFDAAHRFKHWGLVVRLCACMHVMNICSCSMIITSCCSITITSCQSHAQARLPVGRARGAHQNLNSGRRLTKGRNS